MCYCDDLLIHSASFEEHMQHLAAVFSMLRSIGLKLHPEKTLLCCDAVEFLGHMVSAEGLTPAEAKVLAFQAVRAPRSLKELQALLGGFNYYRCYIPDFSTIVEPLTRLTRKGVVWGPDTWAAEQQAALDRLKELFSQYPVLQRVQPGRHLILHTDFSGVGVAGVLGQLDEQGREHLCACVICSLIVHECNYMPYKGELLAGCSVGRQDAVAVPQGPPLHPRYRPCGPAVAYAVAGDADRPVRTLGPDPRRVRLCSGAPPRPPASERQPAEPQPAAVHGGWVRRARG